MNILLLGGCGIQGKGALFDLSKNSRVGRIVCADIQPERVQGFDCVAKERIDPVRLDAADKAAIVSLMRGGIDVAIDLLPVQFARIAAEAAVEAGVSLVNTNYGYDLSDLNARAVENNVALLPECGLDPGIDLVIYGDAARRFDEVEVLRSYCGGFPEKKACDNPLNYKISWNWATVLKTQKRGAVMIRDRKVVEISGDDVHDNDFIHEITFPGIGRLEAIPNGNAVHFTDLLGVTKSIVETGRYSLRWPGWCGFWRPLRKLGIFDETPVPGLPGEISPFAFVTRWLEPKLQYRKEEKDLAVMHNVFIGIRNGERRKLSYDVVIERDVSTGLMGMSLGVSYSACIAAEMIADGRIAGKGILSPVRDIPPAPFFAELGKRGIRIEEADVPAECGKVKRPEDLGGAYSEGSNEFKKEV